MINQLNYYIMHTTIKKKIDLKTLENIFNNYADICNIKHYIWENEPNAEITIRHCEDEDPKKELSLAIKEVKKLQKLFDKLEKKDIQIYNYEENGKLCGYELNTYTDEGVNMILFLDFRDKNLNPYKADDVITEFKDKVNSIDIDEEIDLHRQDRLYRDNFTISQSIKDFTNWKKKLVKIFA